MQSPVHSNWYYIYGEEEINEWVYLHNVLVHDHTVNKVRLIDGGWFFLGTIILEEGKSSWFYKYDNGWLYLYKNTPFDYWAYDHENQQWRYFTKLPSENSFMFMYRDFMTVDNLDVVGPKNNFVINLDVSAEQSFLDIYFESSCEVPLFIYVETSQNKHLVRYRTTDPYKSGEFHIDMFQYLDQNVNIKLENRGNCNLRFNYVLDERKTHFPADKVNSLQSLYNNKFNSPNPRGVNDLIHISDVWVTTDFEFMNNVNLVTKAAENGGFDYVRFEGLPTLKAIDLCSYEEYEINFNYCIHSVHDGDFLESSVHRTDLMYELLFDRGIVAFPVIHSPSFDFKSLGILRIDPSDQVDAVNWKLFQQYNFLQNFDLINENSKYWNFETQTCDPFELFSWAHQGIFHYRFDLPDWLLYDLTVDLLQRYRNSFIIAEVLNEPNYMSQHAGACVNSLNNNFVPNSYERDYFLNKVNLFYNVVGNHLKDSKTLVYGGLAATPFYVMDENKITPYEIPSSLFLQRTFEPNRHLFNFMGVHHYFSTIYLDEKNNFDLFFEVLNKGVEYYYQFGLPIIFTEFGFTVFNFDDIESEFDRNNIFHRRGITEFNNFVDRDNRIHSGAYWQAMGRHFFAQNFVSTSNNDVVQSPSANDLLERVYVETAVFDNNLNPNLLYLNQFKSSSLS